MQLYQRWKTSHFFQTVYFEGWNWNTKFPGKWRKNTLKSIPWRQSHSVESLRSRWYQPHSSKQRYVTTARPSEENYANRITCQSYNIDKLYVSSISPSTISSIDIGQINEVITTILLDHQNITSNDLRVDGIHLANVKNANFQRIFIRQILLITQISWEMIHNT